MAELNAEVQLDSQRVYDGRIVRLDVDTVRLAGGGESVREVVRHGGAALVIPVDAEGQVTLIRQFRYATGQVLLEAPAGGRDGEEPPLACAQRELAEETGLGAGEWVELGHFYTTPGFTDEIIWVFLARDLRPVSGFAADHDEEIEIVRMPLAEAHARALRGEILDAKTVCGLVWAGARLAAGP
ncbi:MAG TPA: ADP-ribose pyrophosphatase [Armatimonadetes bacterium]|nr:ADP-ribose pyrophosphatase [Armatimonadota bacterium]